MSAQYILRYRGQPVRVLALPGRAAFEIVPRAMATVFISQADAWHKAYELDLQPDLLAIESLQEPKVESGKLKAETGRIL